jgi:Fe-Mn family superoxide dismutase
MGPWSVADGRPAATPSGEHLRSDRKGQTMATYTAKTYTPKQYRERSFDLKGLDGISDAQITEHLALYAGYVKQVNTLNQDIAAMVGRGQASGKSPEFAEVTRRLGFEYNGMILHEYYFSNLRAAGAPEPPASSGLAGALVQSFGSVEQWRADFQAIGEMRGVGWVILFQDPATDRLTNHWITLHQDGVPAGFKPLLVMDVWEHAFMRDYKATERNKYVDAFFRNIDWRCVERRLEEEGAVRPAA